MKGHVSLKAGYFTHKIFIKLSSFKEINPRIIQLNPVQRALKHTVLTKFKIL